MNFFASPAFIGSLMTIFFGSCFCAVLIYTFLIKSNKSCEEAASVPLHDEALDDVCQTSRKE